MFVRRWSVGRLYRRYWGGKSGQHDRLRQRYAAAPGRAIHTGRLGRGSLVHPPRLRPQSSALDCSRIRFDDGICERVLPIDARKHPEARARTCRNASPWGFSTRWRNTGHRSVESEPRIPTRYSNSVMARQPARWRACPAKRILSTGRPPSSLAGRADTSRRRFPGSA